MELQPLSLLDSSTELWRGARIRLLNQNGLLPPKVSYYDYLLTLLPWDSEYMILVNITENSSKAGAVYLGRIRISHQANRVVVTIKDLQKAMGDDFDSAYLLSSS